MSTNKDDLPALININEISIRKEWFEKRAIVWKSFLKKHNISDVEQFLTEENEIYYLNLIHQNHLDKEDELLRDVFLKSRDCGLEISNKFECFFESGEILKILNNSNLFCFQGVINEISKNDVLTLSRNGCSNKNNPFICNYFRESADGLVMGMGESARYARHLSVGNGNELCFDVFYNSSYKKWQFGDIPDDFKKHLSKITDDLFASDVVFTPVGINETTFFYQMVSNGKSPCGAGAQLLVKLVEKSVHSYNKNLVLCDVTPRGVLKEGE